MAYIPAEYYNSKAQNFVYAWSQAHVDSVHKVCNIPCWSTPFTNKSQQQPKNNFLPIAILSALQCKAIILSSSQQANLAINVGLKIQDYFPNPGTRDDI